jgi:hypothetical protein
MLMYKVNSIIRDLPYGHRGLSFRGGINEKYFIEWFKRHETEGYLIGLSQSDASTLKQFLDSHCKAVFESNLIVPLSKADIPHEKSYDVPDNSVPQYYPLEDLQRFGVVNRIPFPEDSILGFNRFIH